MLMMCAGTLLLGLAPGYATLGVAAPLMVLLARLIQGLAIGGQFSLSSVVVVETAPPGKKMFLRQLQYVVPGAGHVAVIRLQLSADQ